MKDLSWFTCRCADRSLPHILNEHIYHLHFWCIYKLTTYEGKKLITVKKGSKGFWIKCSRSSARLTSQPEQPEPNVRPERGKRDRMRVKLGPGAVPLPSLHYFWLMSGCRKMEWMSWDLGSFSNRRLETVMHTSLQRPHSVTRSWTELLHSKGRRCSAMTGFRTPCLHHWCLVLRCSQGGWTVFARCWIFDIGTSTTLSAQGWDKLYNRNCMRSSSVTWVGCFCIFFCYILRKLWRDYICLFVPCCVALHQDN